MPNIDEQEAKTIEFSSIGNGNEITGNIPEKKKIHNRKGHPSQKGLPPWWG